MTQENASGSLIENKVFLATIILLGILIIAAGAVRYLIPTSRSPKRRCRSGRSLCLR